VRYYPCGQVFFFELYRICGVGLGVGPGVACDDGVAEDASAE
jgi:hypothetical protein